MPQATFVQEGSSIDYTPGSAVVSGQVVVTNDLVGVARTPIEANALGSLAIEGVFDFPKATGGSTAIALGATCYWDNANQRATTTASGNKLIGKCVKAAVDADAMVRIKLMQ
jgi:predicted RecA/RadA family phage recombinase